MKLIVAGSRGFNDARFLEASLIPVCRKLNVTEIVSGGARGADHLGEAYAHLHNIPLRRFLPDWNRHGKSAGFRRNEEMAAYADALAAFWDGESRGTRHMISIMRKLEKPVYVLMSTTGEFREELR